MVKAVTAQRSGIAAGIRLVVAVSQRRLLVHTTGKISDLGRLLLPT
jgi:hypothetical protein